MRISRFLFSLPLLGAHGLIDACSCPARHFGKDR